MSSNNTVALVHPHHGTHFVYDRNELESHLKRGWTVRPDNWKELKRAARTPEQIAADEKKEKEEADRRAFEAWKAQREHVQESPPADAATTATEAEAPKAPKRTKTGKK